MDTEVGVLRLAYNVGYTRTYLWRHKQLCGLLDFFVKEQSAIEQALFEDLGKSVYESRISEIARVKLEINWAIHHLREWMKPENVSNCGPLFAFHGKHVVREPLGIVLIISPWNYPFVLSFDPLIGAIAAGNCVILKPSEYSKASSQLIVDKLLNYVDERCIMVKTGGPEVVTDIIDTGLVDHIVFTGSSRVGKIVSEKAAKFMIPVTLECGGKSPAIVLSDCSTLKAAKSICFGKFTNAGQTCIAPDYVLIEESIADKFIRDLERVISEWYPFKEEGCGERMTVTTSFGKIITKQHFDRLVGYLSSEHTSPPPTVIGGQYNSEQSCILPCVMTNVSTDHPIMNEEIFGPILPVLRIPDLESAIGFVKSKDKPLAIYLYTNDNTSIEKVTYRSSSGALCVNECLLQVTVPGFPFGGVGQSGHGKLNWQYSFQTLSNEKTVLYKSEKLDCLNDLLLYPPYTEQKVKTLTRLLEGSAIGSVCLQHFWTVTKYTGIIMIFSLCGFFTGLHWRKFHFGF